MRRQQRIFLLAGFLAGMTAAVAGKAWLWVLEMGVGLILFIALLAAIALTGSWPRPHGGLWRYVLAAFVSTVAYFLAFLTFWWSAGYMQTLLGDRSSNDLSEFRLDIWVSLIAAAIIAAVCIELMAYVLTNKWSNSVLVQLVGAGILSIIFTFIAIHLVRFGGGSPSLHYWSFYGTLFSSGEALFCGLVGMQIQQTSS